MCSSDLKTAEGLVLVEVAPGIDIQKQVLDQMEFAPIIPKGGPKLMDPSIFQEIWSDHPLKHEGDAS